MSAMDVPADEAAGKAVDRAAEKEVARTKAVTYISWVALALMTTSSVASLRPAPTMAVYGLACIFLYRQSPETVETSLSGILIL